MAFADFIHEETKKVELAEAIHQEEYKSSDNCNQGRPSICAQNPDILKYIKEALSQDEKVQAHSRLRDNPEIIYGGIQGLKLDEMKKHIIQRIKEEKNEIIKLSNKTIRRTMLPPHMAWRSSKRYRKLMNAKLYQSTNRKSISEHDDVHYCSAQVNYITQLMSKFLGDSEIFRYNYYFRLN